MMMQKSLRLLMIAALALGNSGCTRLYFTTLNRGGPEVALQSPSQPPEGVPGIDVYRAQQPHAPVVVFFYGGRWQDGKRADYAYVGRWLAAAGVTTVIPDYRLYPDVRYPVFVEDAAAAVAWVFEHADALDIDPRRVFVSGHSAGAHIAALLATDAKYLARHQLRPRDLAGEIGLSGPYDFLPLTDDDLVDIFSADPARQADSQPVNHVEGDEPPFLLLHGDGDLLVWPRNSIHLKARLDAVGVPAELKIYRGIGHIRMLASLRYPSLGDARRDLVEFVRATPRSAFAATPGAAIGRPAAH